MYYVVQIKNLGMVSCVFNSEKFWQLILMDKDMAAGWYCTEDGKTTSVAHWLEEDDFRSNGGVMNHETIESMGKRRKPFQVDYTGFGWFLGSRHVWRGRFFLFRRKRSRI